MKLFREKDRLEQDRNTLKISDPRDYALFPRYKELGFKNILYPYPLSEEFIKATQTLSCQGYRECETFLKPQSASLRNIFQLVYDDFPVCFWKIALDLNRFNALARLNNTLSHVSLRCNSDYPQPDSDEGPHIHSATFVLTLKGDETLIKNEEGGYYKAPGLMLIGDHVEHYAPIIDTDTSFSSELKRINFVCN